MVNVGEGSCKHSDKDWVTKKKLSCNKSRYWAIKIIYHLYYEKLDKACCCILYSANDFSHSYLFFLFLLIEWRLFYQTVHSQSRYPLILFLQGL